MCCESMLIWQSTNWYTAKFAYRINCPANSTKDFFFRSSYSLNLSIKCLSHLEPEGSLLCSQEQLLSPILILFHPVSTLIPHFSISLYCKNHHNSEGFVSFIFVLHSFFLSFIPFTSLAPTFLSLLKQLIKLHDYSLFNKVSNTGMSPMLAHRN